MIIGVPKEIKKEEYRVGITPEGVEELKKDSHTRLVEAGAGEGSGFSDEEYLQADADIVIGAILVPGVRTLVIKGILDTYKGFIVHKGLAESMGITYKAIEDLFK